MSQVLRERAIGMLTAGMSTRAVARELNAHFSTISRLQGHFREFGSTSRPHNRRPRVITPAQDLHIQHLHLQDHLRPATRTASYCITKEFLHKLTESVPGKLICMLVVLIGVSTWLQFVVVTDLSGQMLTFDGVWHFEKVADGRQRVCRHLGERFADVNVVDRVAHGGSGVMVWAGRYRDEILRPIVVPFIHDYHLMLHHDNARICTQFLEAENIPVLAWPAYSPDTSPIEHVWDALDRRIQQHVPVPANIQQLRTAIEEEWTNIPQATISNLINSMRRRCVALHEANGGHTRY
ncbi:hypothetical protein M9458_021518 [Cirrhinus mrigala]|uniref:Transposase n=1 Tax=Cirrhinus mrigala TaxID=683832 RepID=A0ABD0Q7C1_CIRMR